MSAREIAERIIFNDCPMGWDTSTKDNVADNLVAAIAAALSSTRNAAIEECASVQPRTAEDPNETAYERGRFDGIIEFAKAIRALKTESTPS